MSDDRNSSALRKADLDWAENNWKQRIIKAGWKYWAIMMPDLEVGKLTMKNLIKDFRDLGITVEIFDDVELAYKWLAEQKLVYRMLLIISFLIWLRMLSNISLLFPRILTTKPYFFVLLMPNCTSFNVSDKT